MEAKERNGFPSLRFSPEQIAVFEAAFAGWRERTSKFRRKAIYLLTRRDFCARCRQVTKWEMHLYRLCGDDRHPAIFHAHECERCGLTLVGSIFPEWETLLTPSDRIWGRRPAVLSFPVPGDLPLTFWVKGEWSRSWGKRTSA